MTAWRGIRAYRVTNTTAYYPCLLLRCFQNGFVACMEEYDPGQAVEVFGDVRFEDDLAAVRKQSCLLPYSGLREGDDKAALYSNGNSLSLVNTRVSIVSLPAV